MAERKKRCNSDEAGSGDADEVEEEEDEENEEEEEESEEQLDQLADRIYLKVQSIPICKSPKERTLQEIEEWSSGRIKVSDSEKFLELLRDNSIFSLHKLDLIKMRVKNLLIFRSKKL